MKLLEEIYFLNLGFGNKYDNDQKIVQRLLIIDIILFLGSFLYVIFDFIFDFVIKGSYGISNLSIFLLLLNSIICLVLYKQKIYLLEKLLTAFIPQILIFGCAFFGMQAGEQFFWLPLVLLGLSVFPIFIFNHKKESKWLILAVIFNLLYMSFYDRILLMGADTQFTELYAALNVNIVFYKSVQIVLYILLIGLLYYVIRVNSHHQLICERVNKSLSRERDNLDYLNAEIQAQRNAINRAASLVITDENGNIQSANKNFCDLSGYSVKELIGKNPRIMKSGYHDDAFFTDLWKTIKGGEIWRGEIKNKRKDNSHYWLDTTIAPLYSRNNKQTGFLAIRFDCTRRKHYEEKLLNLNEEKENILYAIAHDLKNPIINMVALVKLIKKKLLNEEQQEESYELMLKDCKYSVELINQLLEAGKLENEKDGLKKSAVDVKNLLQRSIVQFDEAIKKKHLRVKMNLSNTPPLVEVNEEKFLRAISNLIHNAIKFTPNEGKISIEAITKPDGKLEIHIIDTGIGISGKKLPKVFDKFSKVSRPGTNGEKSNGLGLWIVNEIIEMHGGEIKISSKENLGTHVIVSLPA